jgi:AAA15 family ATPase/GTPase
VFNSIKIHNYKGIVDLELFKIPQILLVGGKNNVGKSSLLEAIFLALDRLNPELLSRHFAFRGIGEVPLTPDSWWRPIFHNYDLTQPLKIELCDSKSKSLVFRVSHEPNYRIENIQHTTVIPAVNQESKFATTPKDSPVQSLHIIATYDNKKVFDSHLIIQPQGFAVKIDLAETTSIQGVYISSIARSSPKDDSVRFSQLDLENKTAQALEVVRIIEPKIKALSVVAIGDGSEIHAEVEGFPRKIPISLMGDGVGRILSIVLSILVTSNGVVLVDEIGNGLHHSKLPELWSAISKACITANCQLIATTHNYECLAAAFNSTSNINPSSFSYIRIDRSKKTDKLIATQYTHDELAEALEAEFEVR